MKKFLAVLLSVVFLTPTYATTITVQNPAKKLEQHFRDVKPDSKLNIVLDSAIFRGILQEGSFFRPEAEVPAIMFLDVLLRDSKIEPKSREFSDILAAAVENEIISSETARNLQFDTPLTKLRVLKALVKAKKIRPPRRVSQKFRGVFPLANIVKSRDLPFIEAAVASGMMNEAELKYLQPSELATRREFLTWIYNYFDHGTRQSRLETDFVFERNQRSFRYNSGLKSRFSIDRRNSQLRKIREKQKSLNKTKSKTLRISKSPTTVGRREIPDFSKARNPFPGKDALDEVYNEIVDNYRFAEDLDDEKRQEMIDASLSALVESLDDKYSSYIKPAKSEDFKDSLDGEFEGIGAYVEMIDEKFTIIAPIAGSPAEKFGIMAGDIVTKVNGEGVDGKSIREIVDLITGPARTKVDLEISRNSRLKNIFVIRDKIVTPAVTLKWKKSVPVIAIHQFNHDTINLLNEVIDEISAKKYRGIVLDLRNNPGGYLESAIAVGKLFLKKDEVIFYVESREKTTEYVTEEDGILSDIKNIVVLQNKGTASASEILITALQDHKNIKVVGEKSLGKGTVQSVRDLRNGGLLKLTIAKWLTPKKRWIHEKGISPDIEIANPTNEERKNKIDKQLEAAVNAVLHR